MQTRRSGREIIDSSCFLPFPEAISRARLLSPALYWFRGAALDDLPMCVRASRAQALSAYGPRRFASLGVGHGLRHVSILHWDGPVELDLSRPDLRAQASAPAVAHPDTPPPPPLTHGQFSSYTICRVPAARPVCGARGGRRRAVRIRRRLGGRPFSRRRAGHARRARRAQAIRADGRAAARVLDGAALRTRRRGGGKWCGNVRDGTGDDVTMMAFSRVVLGGKTARIPEPLRE